MKTINWNMYLDYNENTPPPSMREIIFVKGSEYEMGYQYGNACKEMIKRNFCLVASDALKAYSKEEVEGIVDRLYKEIESKNPLITDWYKGIAAGAEMSLYDVALINFQLWTCIPYLMCCSTIAAKDSATKDGKLIAGINGDVTYNMSGYGVTLVAFPDEGNPFITLPQLAGQMGSNFVINNKGVTVIFTGGESELPEDKQFGCADFISGMVYACYKSNTAEEAGELFSKINLAGGWIFLFADSEKELFITEHTHRAEVVRRPGDFGEKDFIHAANHFVTEEMRKSSIPVEYNRDSYYRYDTERKLLEEKLGELDLENMMAILGCINYWDGEKWIEDPWGEEESNNTPEMRSPDFRTGTRCFAVPEDKAAYILHGTTDVPSSYMPYSTGKFCKIVLGETESDTALQMEADATLEIWNAAKRIHMMKGKVSDHAMDKHMNRIENAKEYLWAGKNCMAKAALYIDADKDEAYRYYSKAASNFGYAYVIAQMVG